MLRKLTWWATWVVCRHYLLIPLRSCSALIFTIYCYMYVLAGKVSTINYYTGPSIPERKFMLLTFIVSLVWKVAFGCTFQPSWPHVWSITHTLGDSRKYPYPTTGGMSILTPPCPQKFQNAHPPLALRIPKSLTPPPLQNFPFLFQILWNSCSTA